MIWTMVDWDNLTHFSACILQIMICWRRNFSDFYDFRRGFYDFLTLSLFPHFYMILMNLFFFPSILFQVFAAIQHVKFVSKHSHVNQRLRFIIAATRKSARSNAPFVTKHSQQRLVNKMPPHSLLNYLLIIYDTN